MHDQLTGLPNRSLIEELLEHAFASAGRRGAHVGVLFIDVDRFKTINDTHGHRAGDRVLQVLADRMQAAVRAGDTVGRISEDEFIVACEDIPHHEDAFNILTRVAQRLRDAIDDPIELDRPGTGVTVSVTASIGIAVNHRLPTAAALIHTADTPCTRPKPPPAASSQPRTTTQPTTRAAKLRARRPAKGHNGVRTGLSPKRCFRPDTLSQPGRRGRCRDDYDT